MRRACGRSGSSAGTSRARRARRQARRGACPRPAALAISRDNVSADDGGAWHDLDDRPASERRELAATALLPGRDERRARASYTSAARARANAEPAAAALGAAADGPGARAAPQRSQSGGPMRTSPRGTDRTRGTGRPQPAHRDGRSTAEQTHGPTVATAVTSVPSVTARLCAGSDVSRARGRRASRAEPPVGVEVRRNLDREEPAARPAPRHLEERRSARTTRARDRAARAAPPARRRRLARRRASQLDRPGRARSSAKSAVLVLKTGIRSWSKSAGNRGASSRPSRPSTRAGAPPRSPSLRATSQVSGRPASTCAPITAGSTRAAEVVDVRDADVANAELSERCERPGRADRFEQVAVTRCHTRRRDPPASKNSASVRLEPRSGRTARTERARQDLSSATWARDDLVRREARHQRDRDRASSARAALAVSPSFELEEAAAVESLDDALDDAAEARRHPAGEDDLGDVARRSASSPGARGPPRTPQPGSGNAADSLGSGGSTARDDVDRRPRARRSRRSRGAARTAPASNPNRSSSARSVVDSSRIIDAAATWGRLDA